MNVSVIISNFNGEKYLPRLLETVYAQQQVSVQVIVVDRQSTDSSSEILATYPDVIVVSEPPESGLVTGYAVGAEHATSDYLFFCNEDMWFDEYCLRRLLDQIDLPNRIAAADPWQWTYDKHTWIHGGTRFRKTWLNLNCPDPTRAYNFTTPLSAGEIVPFACAGAVMIHREVYHTLGGWDRGFFLDHEDVDFFLRAWQHGWRCVSVPDACVYHAVNVSNAKSLANGRQPVSRRRYISGRSSLPIIGVKYFSFPLMFIPIALWFLMTVRHVVTFQFQKAWWHLLAGKEFLRRLPGALRHRWDSRSVRKHQPGEAFFREPAYQES